jgi:signal transduction histidine kinase/ActR/RegA family two-component response regulator
MPRLTLPENPPLSSRIQFRMAWRLMLCLFGHLALLFFLAVYLVTSLNRVQLFTPEARADEIQLESVKAVPALLAAMDTQRQAYQKTADPHELMLYQQARAALQANLDSLHTPLILPSDLESKRRALVQKWMTEIGDSAVEQPRGKPAQLAEINAASGALLAQIDDLTTKVENEQQTKLQNLEAEEAREGTDRVNLMWVLVGSVSFFTILIQLALANSIIGPIQSLTNVVRRLQAGDYTARARLRSGDELQSLGESFNGMAESILEGRHELEDKNNRLSVQQEALRYANAGLEERVNLKTKELEDKNQKLNDAVRLKDEFLATLSHELRTPLTPIISCTHLLNADGKLSPEEYKSVQVIDRNARALSRMIDELLDLSIVTNRKLRLIRERTEMNDWTQATLETVRPECERKGLEVRFIASEEPIELEIDATRLTQVLTNLMTNAIKYTDRGGQITVRVSQADDGVRIAVSDTGAGLSKGEIGRIFEMFHQSRTPHTQAVGGLGVGLAVARSIAELHGGGLLAESAGPGKGATFTLWLPRLSDAQAVDFSVPSLTPLPDTVDRRLLRGRRILIVEDSDDTREALERIFRRRACEVTSAASAEDALHLVNRTTPDIIISDLGLPGMSGIEFMTEVRKRPEWREVVAVALSGLGREKDFKAANEAGFDAYLLKPVDIASLDQTLADALQKRMTNGFH